MVFENLHPVGAGGARKPAMNLIAHVREDLMKGHHFDFGLCDLFGFLTVANNGENDIVRPINSRPAMIP